MKRQTISFRIVFLSLLLSFFLSEETQASTTHVTESPDSLFYYEVGVKPSFNGGDQTAFPQWVYENIQYPEEAVKTKSRVLVVVQFTVNEDGSVGNVRTFEPRVLKGKPKKFIDKLEKEAARVVSASPSWAPGQNGEPVKTICFLTIDFNFKGKKNPPSPDEEYLSISTSDIIPLISVDTPPLFMGKSVNAFAKWVTARLVYPPKAKADNAQGRVLVSFTIDTCGAISDLKLVKSVRTDLDIEAIRVISMSPKWTPAIKNDRPVKVFYRFPVVFMLRSGFPSKN